MASRVATWPRERGQLVAESEPYTKVTNLALLSTDMYIYVDRSQATRRKGITGHAEAW